MPLSAVQTPKWFIGYQITRSSKIKKVSRLKTTKLKLLWDFFQQTFLIILWVGLKVPGNDIYKMRLDPCKC